MDTLAFGYMLPVIRAHSGLSPVRTYPCWAYYNTRQDITERNDLSGTNPEKLQEMAQALTAKLKGYDALLPTFRSTGEVVPMPDELVK